MKPFLHGKKSIDNQTLRVTRSPVASTSPGAASNPPHGPTVETVKQGDKVVRLIVTCSCGERIEVECLYPAGK